MLPIMLSVRQSFPDYQFVIAGAPSLTDEYYREIAKDTTIPVLSGKTYELLSVSSAALVTSGTATLETALLGIPQVVCYKGGRISYAIARSVVKVKYISLVNLIMDRKVVTELIQDELSKENLTAELKLLFEPSHRDRLIKDYNELKTILGGSGASAKAADLMVSYSKS